MLYKSLGTLDYHFRYYLVMFGKFIKCRINNLYIITNYSFLYICNLFWSFID